MDPPPPQAAIDQQSELTELIPTRDRTYGERKRVPFSEADRKDKIMETEKENNALQEKENYLRQEILMMETKLRRVEELCTRRARAQENAGDYNITD